MATESEKNWIDSVRVAPDYRSMHEFIADGVSDTVEVNFTGGFLNVSHVKAEMLDTVTAIRTDIKLDRLGKNTFKMTPKPSAGFRVTIWRDTPKEVPMLSFSDGAMITALNLDRNAKQAIFAVAEMVDRFSLAYRQVELAEMYANAARESASNAETNRKMVEALVERFGLAQEMVDEMERQLNDAISSAQVSNNAAREAEQYRNEAKNSADMAQSQAMNAATFPTIQAGMASTVDGGYFRVPQGMGAERSFIYYHNSGGMAIEASELIGMGTVNNRVPLRRNSAEDVIVVEDQSGNVPVWLTDGNLNATGVATALADLVMHASPEYQVTKAKVTSHDAKLPDRFQDPSDVIVVEDKVGNVPVWLSGGMLDATGAGPSLLNYLATHLNIDPEPQPTPETDWGNPNYVASSGSTLWNVKQAIGRALRKDQNGQVRIMFTGDSWTEHRTISQAMADIVYPLYGKAGEGWITFNIDNPNLLNGITLDRSPNWRIYDGSAASHDPFETGSGPDANVVTSNTGNEYLVYSELECLELDIFYMDRNGSFRVSVDGGTPTVVHGTDTRVPLTHTVKNMGPGKHTVRIDTLGNAGWVSLHGLRGRSVKVGAEVNKVGNGGIRAHQFAPVLKYIPHYAKILDPHLIFMVIGTNDYRTNTDIKLFETSLRNWIQTYQTAVPNAGIVVVAPAQSNAGGVKVPLREFVKVQRRVAEELGVECYMHFNTFPANYSVANAAGLWKDSLHISTAGADLLCRDLAKLYT